MRTLKSLDPCPVPSQRCRDRDVGLRAGRPRRGLPPPPTAPPAQRMDFPLARPGQPSVPAWRRQGHPLGRPIHVPVALGHMAARAAHGFMHFRLRIPRWCKIIRPVFLTIGRCAMSTPLLLAGKFVHARIIAHEARPAMDLGKLDGSNVISCCCPASGQLYNG